ncbi:MAG: hypothetical protein EOP53_08980, partial [Sphingobacteriales bacterium]
MKNKLPYFIVITAALLICYLYFPPNDPPFDDPQLFKYFGMAIQKGKIPYRDFFDHKPPLIYFFNYVGVLLGNYGIYLLNTLFVLLAALKFLQLNIQFRIPFPFVLPVLFCLLLKHPNYSFGGNFTREYSTLLILIAFCCLLGKSRYKMFWTGLTASLVFFFQQEQLLILVPFIGAALYEVFIEQKWRGVYRSAASLTAGFLIPCVLIFGYFLLNNSLTQFLDSAFAFNFRWYTVQAEKPGFITEMFALKKLFYQFNLDTALLVTVGIILIGFLFANSRKIWLIGAVIALPLSLISEWMSAKIAIGDAMCYYYLVPLAGTIPIALFLVLAFSKNELIKNKVFIAFCYVLLTFNLLLTFMEYAGNRFRYNYHYKESAPETLFLNKVALKDNDLYIWRSSEYIFLYNKYKILAPDKWVYHSFW